MKKKTLIICLILVSLTSIFFFLPKSKKGFEILTHNTSTPYIIFPKSNNVVFQVEVADTPGNRARGLMFRNQLESEQGMLFIFEEPKIQSFWMKNTYIPLDIIFLDSQQKIVTIYANTKPKNTEIKYKPTEPSQFVIELNAGSCEKHNIQIGDYVQFYL